MNNKNIDCLKKERGAITLYVILSVVFFAVIIIGAYVIANRKLQAQYEAIAKEADMYNKEQIKNEDDEENSNIVPIYTVDQFNKIGNDENESVYIYQTGKTYQFSLDKQYVLKDNIELKINSSEWRNGESNEIKIKNAKGNIINIDSDSNYRIGLSDGYVYFDETEWKFIENGWHQDDSEVYFVSGMKEVNRLQIGDIVNYKPNVSNASISLSNEDTGYVGEGTDQTINLKAEGVNWIVIGVEGGNLKITTTENVTKNVVNLRGQKGYENGIEILDEIANLYQNGNGAESARSINVDDINKITGYDPETAGYEDEEIYKYGNEVTYYWGDDEFPCYYDSDNKQGVLENSHDLGFYWYDIEQKMWNNSHVGENNSTTEENKITTLKSTYYSYYPQSLNTNLTETDKGISESSDIYEKLFTGESYWLASQYIFTGKECANFGIRCVNPSDIVVQGKSLFGSDEGAANISHSIRPVVYLKADVKLESAGANTWNIVVNN